MNLKELYYKYVEIFKSKIKDDYINLLFEEKRISLKAEHTKNNQEPEALTSDIIKEMLRECGINPLDISREIIIKGKNKNLSKTIKRKPDFYIESENEDLNRHLLFEIEALNKNLQKEGDGEGIEQANEWFNVKKPLFLQYNAIITNFLEWFILFYDDEKESLEVEEKKPWEILEIILNVKFGRGREYSLKDAKQKREISNTFYNGFRERLNKLLNKPSGIKLNLEVINLGKSPNITQKEHEQNLIDYYRIIFSRLLFIKILESWKLLPFDPISEHILKEQKWHWHSDLRILFFDVFNKKPEDRPKEIPEKFKILPYLNGGLFRPYGIELDETGTLREVHLNSDGIKDIWDFFNRFKFVEEDSSIGDHNGNTINPEILGYIFERSIGEERKKTGSYYTPDKITDYIVENTLYPFIIEKVNKYLKKLKIKEIEKISEIDFLENSVDVYDYILNDLIRNIKICDPACGSGAFLKKAADKLLYIYKKCYKGCGRILPYKYEGDSETLMPFSDIYSIKEHILQNNLYGVDINHLAVEICELRLWLWVIKPPRAFVESQKSFTCPPLPNIEYNVRSGNSLLGYIQIPKALEKSTRIDEILFKDMLQEKNKLIKSYYREKQFEINQIRKKINDITNKYQDKLNSILISDYQKELRSDISIPPLKITDYMKDSTVEIFKLKDSIRQLNTKYQLTKFKINCKSSFSLDANDIRKKEGITCSIRRNLNSIKSIYPTSTFDFKYYSEAQSNTKRRFSEFIASLLTSEDWKHVEEIELERKINIEDVKKFKPFHWFLQFTEVYENGGFDIIVGNPPYGGNIRKIEIESNSEINISKPNIAKIFIIRVEKLIKSKGFISLLAPKSLTYASDWQNIRNLVSNNLLELFDVKEAFKDVLLEQIFYISKNNSLQSYYIAKDFFSQEEPFQISKNSIEETLYCDISSDDFQTISSIKVDQKLTDLIKTYRGLPLQQFIVEGKGEKALEGRNIKLYGFKEPYRTYDLDQGGSEKRKNKINKLKKNITKYQRHKLVFQNIVAFINNPVPHIKVMGSYDNEGLIPTDTVNVIETKEGMDEMFILGFMNSVFFSWLLHRVAYNKAVRTMHLDNYALSKIPIPKLKQDYVDKVINQVKDILNSKFDVKKYFEIEKSILKLYSLTIKKMPADYQTLLDWKLNG